MPFGDLQVHVCLIILCLLTALSIRTTPKGTGAFWVFHQATGANWRIPESCVFCSSFVFFPKGRLPFVEFQIQICSRYSTFYNNNHSLICSKEGYLFGAINIHLTTRTILVVLDTFTWPGAIWGSPDSCCASHSTSLVYSNLLISS